MKNYFMENNWKVVYETYISEKPAKYYGYSDLDLTTETKNMLQTLAPNGLYNHQKVAIKEFLDNKNVCLYTKTSSGKSLVFYASAVQHLKRYPNSKILAVYPSRALSQEQNKRWKNALNAAGLNHIKVGHIDGQVPVRDRLTIIKNVRILTVTPDIIHAWMMSNLSNKRVLDFISRISLVVVDEVHTYKGVFGSNAAYLFRILQHVMGLTNNYPQYIVSSATINNPKDHVSKLFGLDFVIIDSSFDTSPQKNIKILLVNPPSDKNLLTSFTQFIKFVSENTNHKFITFVDSRKQTEYITSIVMRKDKDSDYPGGIDNSNVLPYRSGYELEDRKRIQHRLSSGDLKGVISTSALELGIDIKFLDLAILYGVPKSATSFFQRIGRIGRHSDGYVVIINSKDIYSESLFRNPKRLFDMPLEENSLYLENSNMQYIHALCLSRHGGENDQVCSLLNKDPDKSFLDTKVRWPKGFLELCSSERSGVIPVDLQNMKMQAGEDPNHFYPLRNIDITFSIKNNRGFVTIDLGKISYSQVMREAYPGAVYYYATKPFRVYRVDVFSKKIYVRSEKHYTTEPKLIPPVVYPYFDKGKYYSAKKYGELVVAKTDLQIRESVVGFIEKRGKKQIKVNYPLQDNGLYYNKSTFVRNYFTTGTVIYHPSFDNRNVELGTLTNIMFEAFLLSLSFDSNDINYSSGKYKANTGILNKGSKFVCVYDKTYGSLHLSNKIFEHDNLKSIVEKMLEIPNYNKDNKDIEINDVILDAIEKLYDSVHKNDPKDIDAETINGIDVSDSLVPIIMPDSKGISLETNQVFLVKKVFYSPYYNSLAYSGVYLNNLNRAGLIQMPINSLKEIPGESVVGYYDLKNGDITAA